MSSSSASRDALLARPLQHNPHWADVTPLKQDDGEAEGALPVVPINYPAHYSDVMDMFRAVLRSNELSARTLLLSEAVIDCNSANYSAWHFRRLCLEQLGSDLSAELDWVATVALDTPKNYQSAHQQHTRERDGLSLSIANISSRSIRRLTSMLLLLLSVCSFAYFVFVRLWHHRRCLLDKLGDRSPPRALQELQLTADVLAMDSKNYHGWSHRQWCLHFFARHTPAADGGDADQRVDVFAAELVYIDSLLEQDVRNNSAWNQRFFVHSHRAAAAAAASNAAASEPAPVPGSTGTAPQAAPFAPEVLSSELSYTSARLSLAPHNESPWNYLEGLVRQQHFGPAHRLQLLGLLARMPTGYPPALPPLAEDDDATDEQLCERVALLQNRFAQSLLVELWQAGGGPNPEQDLAFAGDACETLANELDPLRCKYWMFRKQQIDAKINKQ